MTIKTSETNSKQYNGAVPKALALSFFAFVILSLVAFSGIQITEADSDMLSSNGIVLSADGKEIVSCPSNISGTLQIPDGVESIGEYAFYGCDGITGSIIIPASVKSIGQGAFAGCGGTEFIVDANNTEYASVGGLLLTKDLGTVVACPTGMSGDMTIPKTVTEIGYLAFLDCKGLTGSLTITENVECIRGFAFAGCDGLKYIEFRCGTDVVVEDGAFLGIDFLDEEGNPIIHTGANLGAQHFAGFDSKLTVNADFPNGSDEPDYELAIKILIVGMLVSFGAILYRFRDTILWRK